jgi:predicted MFS family arabinose efflux permease
MAFVTGGNNFMYAGGALILIVLAKDLGAGEASIGTMFGIGAVGGILGAVLGGQFQKRFSFGQVIIGTMVLQALIFPFFAVAPNFFALGALFGAIYMLGPIYNVVQFSYRLALIPDELQGRVNSTFRLIAFGFQPAGAFLTGLLLEWIGGPGTVYVIAVGVAGLAVAVALNPHVRNARPIAEVQAA